MANRIEMSDATKKGIALAIGALCVCVVGAMLAVGRGSGSTGLEAARGGLGAGCGERAWRRRGRRCERRLSRARGSRRRASTSSGRASRSRA